MAEGDFLDGRFEQRGFIGGGQRPIHCYGGFVHTGACLGVKCLDRYGGRLGKLIGQHEYEVPVFEARKTL